MRLYKIRDINTGLFSTGGRWPGFNTKGKTWSGVGPLKASLNMHAGKPELNNWEVVIYDVYEAGSLPAVSAKTLKNK